MILYLAHLVRDDQNDYKMRLSPTIKISGILGPVIHTKFSNYA